VAQSDPVSAPSDNSKKRKQHQEHHKTLHLEATR